MPSLVRSGFKHTCALIERDAGQTEIWCWGVGNLGQLGGRSGTDSAIPVAVPIDGEIVDLDCGGDTCCALTESEDEAAVQCWGSNASEQLGTSDAASSAEPTAVPLTNGATSIAVGRCGEDSVDCHACALIGESDIVCWGGNSAGQLGRAGDRSSEPGTVNLLEGPFTQIGAGERFTCARGDERIYCWGANDLGMLGDGSVNDRPDEAPPVLVVGDEGDFFTGASHACMLVELGDGAELLCWGDNSEQQARGEEGLGHVAAAVLEPGVKTASAGHEHSCAITRDDEVMCWGNPDHHRTGPDATADGDNDRAPRLVPFDTGRVPRQLTAGGRHSCALVDSSSSSEIWCWGDHRDGQLGNGSVDTNSGEPERVVETWNE